MKTNKFFAALLMGVAVVACSPKAEKAAEGEEGSKAEPVKTSKDYEASKAQKDSVAYLVGVNFGSFIKNYDFGDLSYAKIKQGMDDFIKAEGDFRDPAFGEQFKINPEEMNRLFNEYLENRHTQKLLANKEAGEKFLRANAKKAGVVETESGLQYKIVAEGNDVKAGPQDTVWVRYKGTLIDGKVFDEVKADQDSVQLVLNGVIAGWTEGLQLIGEGGKIKLFIPADLAYGEHASPAIGPNQTLLFDVEVLKVGKVAEEAPAAE